MASVSSDVLRVFSTTGLIAEKFPLLKTKTTAGKTIQYPGFVVTHRFVEIEWPKIKLRKYVFDARIYMRFQTLRM